MTKIKTITVSNLKAVSSMTADFNGCTAIVTGGNNKGKTSFLRGLMDRLRGLKPDMIVKKGEKEMKSEIELTTGEKFIWEINETGNEKLLFVSTDQLKMPITKAISDKYFPATFDIDKFLNEGPKEQKRMMQNLAGLDLTQIEAEYKSTYDERTFLFRKKEDEIAKAKDLFFDKTLPVEKLPVDDLMKELNTIELHNEKYESARKAVEILETEVKQLKEQLEEKEARLKAGFEWVGTKINQPKTNTEELQKKLDDIKVKNEQIVINADHKRLIDSAEVAKSTWKACDEKVKSIEQKKLEMIKAANLPEGFSFTDDGIEINGMPVTREQLSSSGLYIAALKLAAMKLGNVQTLHFDASHLDKTSLAEIEAWAVKNDLQLLIERPDFEGGEITYELLEAK